ncbi:hypothetical protein TNCV_704901 [Trichonephila clavipes]|nr:hypothetical protein TNCV_704901 [Trichonephila clavipes]
MHFAGLPLAVALNTIQIGGSADLAWFHPKLEGENSGGCLMAYISVPVFTNLSRGLAVGRLFSVPPCRKITIHFKTSIPSPEFEPRP